MHNIEGITLSDRDGALIASCRPAERLAPIDRESLQRLLDDAGYAAWALLPDALTTLAERWDAGGDAFELTLARSEDAHFTIEVAKDGLCAWVNLAAAQGGQPPKLDDMLLTLNGAGVVFGIDQAALQDATKSSVDVRVECARAVLPVKGEDTRFELLVADTRDRTPKVGEDGLIDYHELGDIPTVREGQPLMRRHPPTPGVDGHDVRGQLLHASAGLDVAFDQPFSGAVIAGDDPNLLLAQVAGQPVHSRCGVTVEGVLRLKNVNMATGNVHFVGTVEVAGDVSPGMKVEASGDVIIKGMVEGAQLDAGGSIKVAGGVIAHAAVHAASSVSARFVENSSITAGTAIVIENMALHSDLQALNQVLVGTEAGDRGRLIGGSTRATMLIRAPNLGATAGGVTKVLVGINPALQARHQEFEREIEAEQAEADKLEKLVSLLKQNGDPRQMLEKVQAAWQHKLKEWGRLLEERPELERQLALIHAARIEILHSVSGDVDVAFGKAIKHLSASFRAGAFFEDDQGHIVFQASDGSPPMAI